MLYFGNSRKKKSTKSMPHSTTLINDPDYYSESPEEHYFKFSGVVVSDVGCVRTNNEDNYLLGKYMNTNSSDRSEVSVSFYECALKWQFAGVFDGMGGGEMGELASRDTAAIFIEAVGQLGDAPSKTEVDLCMRKAFLQANNRIIDLQKEYKIFGTTGTVLCSNGVEFKIFHLGDSRAYLARDEELLQLTKDQTLAQMKLEVGMYQEDDPAAEADKHKLTEYIGRDWTRENIKPVESLWIPIEKGDCVLICSDGLYDMCANDEIAEVLWCDEVIGSKANTLVEKARNRGGEDNVTCVLIEYT